VETVRELLFFDPLSYILNGKAASQWFVYTLYTIAIVGLGYKFILKYLNTSWYVFGDVFSIGICFFDS
jgi:general stress protein CsbA